MVRMATTAITAMKADRGAARPRVWLLLLSAAYAGAATAGVDFVPEVSVGVANTDNVLLVPDNPQTATVYELLPSFRLTQKGKRMVSEVDYHLEAYRYQQLSDQDVYQNFNAVSTFALDPDNFFFEVGAARDQTIKDPASPIPLTNLGHTSNRVDRNDYYVKPSFQYPIGDNAMAQGSFRQDSIHYAHAEAFVIPSFETGTMQFSLNNYRKARGATWALKYNSEKTAFDQFEPWEHRQATVEVGGWVARSLRLYASAGKESPWDSLTSTSLTDSLSEVGFATDPDRHVSLDIATGHRSYGTSHRASLSGAFAHGHTALQYSEGPITQGYDYQRDLILGGLARVGSYDLLNRPGVAERFLSKSLSWSLTLDFNRLSFSAAVFDESRAHRVALSGLALEDESQSRVDMLVAWRARARTTVGLGAEGSHRELGTVAYSLTSLFVTAGYQLGRRTTLSSKLTRTTGESHSVVAYRVNVIELTLNRRFTN